MFRRCVVGMIVLSAMVTPGLAVADAATPPAEQQDSAALAVLQNERVIRDENLHRQYHEIGILQSRINDLERQLSSAQAAARESRQRHAAFVARVHRVLLYGGVALAIIVLLALVLLLVRRRRHTENRGPSVDEKPVTGDEPESDAPEEACERPPAEQGAGSDAMAVVLDDLDRLFADQPVVAPCSDHPAECETKQ